MNIKDRACRVNGVFMLSLASGWRRATGNSCVVEPALTDLLFFKMERVCFALNSDQVRDLQQSAGGGGREIKPLLEMSAP